MGTESGSRMESQTWRVWGRNVTKMHREQLLRQGLSLTGLWGFGRATQPIQGFLGQVMQFTRVTLGAHRQGERVGNTLKGRWKTPRTASNNQRTARRTN